MEKFNWSKIQDTHVFNSICILLKDNPYLLEYLFSHKNAKLSASPDILIQEAGGLAHGEQILIKVAIDLWSGEGSASVGEVISVLSYNNMLNFLNALCHIRDINEDLIDILDEKLTLGHIRNR